MRCAVYGCNINNKGKNLKKNMHFRFHSFPKDEELRKQWVLFCGRSDEFNKDTSRICSKHFLESDYDGLNPYLQKLGIPIKSQRLKPNVLPSRSSASKNEDIHSTIFGKKSKKRTRHDVQEFSEQDYLLICNKKNQDHVYYATEVTNALPQSATDNEGPTSLGTEDNKTEICNLKDVKVELLDASPLPLSFQVNSNSSNRIDQFNLHEDLAKQKCEPPVIKRCLLCKDGRSMSHFSPSGASLECNAPLRKNNWNLEEPNTDRWHDVQMQFLNHVILTWVNRCRNGNLNIVMPDSMLKSKAKEAGKILGTFILCTTAWLRVFKDKLRKLEPTGSQMVSQSKEIADIIEEEWTRFRCDDYEPKLDIRSYEESLAIPLGDRSNIVETSIESYQEALDCLMMVKSYAFSVRNLNAVVIITELEDILKLECL